MTHEELRKECYEAFVRAAVKVGKLNSIEEGMKLYESNSSDIWISSTIDAMMEVAAKAWEQGYETSENRHEHFNKINNPYLKL